MSIRITTLGRVQVTRGDAVIAALPSQRLRFGLLVYLAVTRETTRDRLLALFWAERPETRARHALSQNIYELRAVLSEDWVTLRGEQIIVAPHVTADVLAFGEAAERGDAQTAVSLYHGPFLDGFYVPSAPGFEAWLENQRLRAQRQHRRARREWITRLVDQARIRDALQAARDWVALDGQDDEAQHRLIELLAETGDRAGAIRQYEAYERLLSADELEPLDETRALVERIRGGDVGTLPSPPVAVGQPRPPASKPQPALDRREQDPSPAPAVAAAPEERSARPPRQWSRGRSLLAAAAVVLVVLAGYLALRPRVQTAAAPQTHALAILYFDDLSPEGNGVSLSRSLTERLIAELSHRTPFLEVRSRQALAPLRGVSVDSAARALRVDMVVTGSVTRADGSVRVVVELMDGSGTRVSSDAVTLPDGRYLELVDSLVARIERVLRTRMGVHLAQRRLRTGSRSEAAWAAVLEAQQVEHGTMQLQSAHGPDRLRVGLARADSILAAAEKLDRHWSEPVIRRGWLAHTRAAVEMVDGDTSRAQAWLDSAVAHADRALERNPHDAAAFEMRGMTRHRQMSFTSRDRESTRRFARLASEDLLRATELDPHNAGAMAQLASLHYAQGQFQEARSIAQRARDADAFLRDASDIIYTLALAEFEMFHDSVAERYCSEGLERYRDHRFAYCALYVMAWSDSLPPRPDSAWAIAAIPHHRDRGTALDPVLEMLVAATLARAGMQDSAAAVLDRAAGRPSRSAAVGWIEPVVRERLGQRQEALTQIEQYFRRTPRGEAALASRAMAQLARTAGSPRPPADQRIR